MYSHEEIAGIMEAVAQELAKNMLATEFQYHTHYVQPTGTKVFKGILAWVGVTGAWSGIGEIYCSPQAAAELASLMLMEDIPLKDEIPDSVLDVMAEIANMLVGNVKNQLEKKLGTLSITVPSVVSGLCFHSRCALKGPYTVVPITHGSSKIEFKFCLQKKLPDGNS